MSFISFVNIISACLQCADLEPFETRSFVSKLLGMGDMQGLVNKVRCADDCIASSN